MKYYGALLATIISTANGWQVDFTARSNNVGVQLETACYAADGHLSFIAVDYMQVDGNDSRVNLRRHNEVPRKDACAVVAHVMANDNKGDTFFGDPDGDYVIESSAFVEQK